MRKDVKEFVVGMMKSTSLNTSEVKRSNCFILEAQVSLNLCCCH